MPQNLTAELQVRLTPQTEVARISVTLKSMINMLGSLSSLNEALRNHPVKVLWPVQCFATDDHSFAARYIAWRLKVRPDLEMDDVQILQNLRGLRPSIPASRSRGRGYETYRYQNGARQERLVETVRQYYIRSLAANCNAVESEMQKFTNWLELEACKAADCLPPPRRTTIPLPSHVAAEPSGRSFSTSDAVGPTWVHGASYPEHPRRPNPTTPRARERQRGCLLLESSLAAITLADALDN